MAFDRLYGIDFTYWERSPQLSQVNPETRSSPKLFCINSCIYAAYTGKWRSRNASRLSRILPHPSHSIEVLTYPSKIFVSLLRKIKSRKALPNSMLSCWLLFLNAYGPICRRFKGDISLLIDLNKRENSFCN